MKRLFPVLLICACAVPISVGQTASKASLTLVFENGEQLFVDNLQAYQSLTPGQKAQALSYLGIRKREILNRQKTGSLLPQDHGGISVQGGPPIGRGVRPNTITITCGSPGCGGGGGSQPPSGYVTTYYGYGANPLNMNSGVTTSTDDNCHYVGIAPFGVNVCLGSASAWANYNANSGVIVESTAAFGIATADANGWLGASYKSRAPSDVTSTVLVTATVYTEDETGGVSGVGVSCAPLYIYENDFSGRHTDTLASCLSTFSVSIPVFGAGDAATEGEQALTNFLDLLNNASNIEGLLGALPSYNTATFTWSGSLSAGESVGIAVNPDTQAADSGLGTVVNLSSSIVQIEVVESWP